MSPRRIFRLGFCLVLLLVNACDRSKATGISSILGLAAQNQAGQAGTVSGGFLVNQYSLANIDRKKMHEQNLPDASLMDYVADNTVAAWFVGGDNNIRESVAKYADAAKQADATVLLVAYNIPDRDCGLYSAGGVAADQYKTWIEGFAEGIGQAKAMIILEPDAIASTTCLSDSAKNDRFALLSYAVSQLKKAPFAKVYIDAGHPGWLSATDAASRLQAAGIGQADGFVINSDNYIDTQSDIAYGQQISAQVGKGFVIDTGRNGNGATSDEQWCNPSGRAVGLLSTMHSGVEHVDAYVWIHNPGESDGSCNGGPSAGSFWREMALELARGGKHSVATTQTGSSMPVSGGASTATASSSAMWCDPIKTTECWPSCTKPTSGEWGYEPELGGKSGSCHVGTQAVAVGGSTTSAPSPTNPAAAGALQASLQVKSTWADGYCVDIIIKNSGSSAVNSWSLVLDRRDASIDQTWNLTAVTNGSQITYTPGAQWNGAIPAGGSIDQQGFCAKVPSGGSQATIVNVTGG